MAGKKSRHRIRPKAIRRNRPGSGLLARALGPGAAALISVTPGLAQTITISPQQALPVTSANEYASNAVVDYGILDISKAGGAANIATLSGPSSGSVSLGTSVLNLTAAAGTFAGRIFDGNAGGGLAVQGGTETLSGANSYTGATAVSAGATLALSATGAIAASSGVAVAGTLDISGVTGSTQITTMTGSGTVALGGNTLALTNTADTFAGTIVDGGLQGGAGGSISIQGGTGATFTAKNTYTGATTIAAGTALTLSGSGSIANSAYVSVGGTFDISKSTAGASVRQLSETSGTGIVELGSQTLTLTGGSGPNNAFAGVIQSTGGNGNLTVAGGTQVLSGANTYTGVTTVNSGATLALSGGGLINASAGVVVNGTLDISQGSGNPQNPIATLSGSGAVKLGQYQLQLVLANDTFSGVISDGGLGGGTGGSVDLAGGTETFTGANTYTGLTNVESGNQLNLAGGGSIANSTVQVDGTLDISGTTSGTSIAALTSSINTGVVNLGARTLTLTGAGSTGATFTGLIQGTGGLTVAGGEQTLTAAETYTGATGIGNGATLALTGAGSIAASSGLADNGTFDVSGAASPVSITALAGSGSVVLGATSLTITNDTATAYSGAISGTGGLVINAGTATVTGASTYSGGTAINTATVLVGGTSALGTGAVVITNGTLGASTAGASLNNAITLAGTSDIFSTGTGTSLTLNGVISGALPLAVTGGGTIAVAGTNTYGTGSPTNTSVTGGSTLKAASDASLGNAAGGVILGDNTSSGTLLASSTFTTARTVTLAQGGGGLGATAGNTLTVSSAIAGTGALTVTGGGALALTGSNTYGSNTAGNTTVRGGSTLLVGADTALGASGGGLTLGDVGSSGTLEATATFSTARSVVIAGGGGVIDANGFVLTLTGTITQVGTLQTIGGGGSGKVVMTGPTTVNAMTVTGGTSVNSGTVNAQSGVVIANGSTFYQNGTVNVALGTVTVNGVLRGDGTINAPTTVTGTLYPGDSPGTLTFTAPVTMASTATYAIDIDGTGTGSGAGNYGRTLVTGAGNTFTAAGTIVPTLRGITGSATNTYTPPVTTSFDVVNASGGVLGTFTSLTQPAAGLPVSTRFDGLYTSKDITLWVTPANYQNLTAFGVTLTPNQQQVGAAFNALRGTAGIRVGTGSTAVLGTLFALQPSALPAAFNQVSGTVYGDALMAENQRSRAFGDMISERLASVREGVGSPTMALVNGGPGVTYWISGIGQTVSVGANGNTGYDASSGGFAVGADKALSPDLLLGMAAGAAFGTVTSNSTGGKDDLTSTFVTAYGTWSFGRSFLDGQIGMNFADNSVRRSMPIFGLQAMANPNGSGVNGSLATGHVFQAGGWQLTPMLGVRVDQANHGTVTESGASALSLAVNSKTATSVLSSLGLRAATSFELGSGYAMSLTGRAFWVHEFSDVGTTTAAAFTGSSPLNAGASNALMTFRTAHAGRDGVAGGLGLDLRTPSKAVTLYLDYGIDARSNATSQAGTMGVRVTW
jgi:outer membrane autotransporter protein